MPADFEAELKKIASRVDSELEALLRPEGAQHSRLSDAMHYAVMGGGKRLRPYLVVASAELFGVPAASAMRTAAALECLHTYSLVHDDLPAMDDDDLRRGRPTAHRAYDEATAILAGDALLTLAFEILSEPPTHRDPAVRAYLVSRLARAAGAQGMAEGQMRDLLAEGKSLSEEEVLDLQGLKTGALFSFAAEAGAILALAPADDHIRLARFGATLGLAFQIADDLLDEEASEEELGKATAKDRAKGKATLPALLGIAEARSRLDAAVSAARDLIEPYGDRARKLSAALDFTANRKK
ncbi:polyprenyl synthetase family protein [Lutibaculum baratangense]|uniref:Probable farnesyl diphosphate synthase n=1 Tax=Lutibaculum baratangense AMV1 TaxID=631454 RepID=V4RD06_9HYPH|nr:farnesyl diphosphate synthase [Lutibaculum baratangense]ESR24031.1 geranyltranstransferase (farnesyl-diphosphate synthase) [Lutibaculum baratangense AMV1]